MSKPGESLGRQLYRMTWPMLIGVLATMSSQLVDSAYIGQLGTQPLAAVGFTIPVFQLIIGIQVGLGIATTTIISTALGAGKQGNARQLGSLVLATGGAVVFVLCLLIWAGQQLILSALGASEALYPLVRAYWLPWLGSCWLGAMLYFGYSIFRANGKTMLPGMVMVLTSLLNIVLDPLFIFVLDMGLAGAAWATICAYGAGCLILVVSMARLRLVQLPGSVVRIRAGLTRLISFVVPSTLSQLVPPLSAMLATAIVAVNGEDAVAAWGLGSRIELMSIIVVLALTMAMPPMIGRLRGSNDLEQIRLLVGKAVKFVVLWQLILAALLAALSAPLSRVLISDGATAAILAEYLWLVPISYGALGLCMIMVSVCNAMGKPRLALVISALRLLGCYLPLIWLGSELYGLRGLFFGATFGNVLAGLMSWYMYKKHAMEPAARAMGSSGRVTI
ncbi:MATE family efflux transporter [Oceanimonas doudoroffii]|uniref:MATE family efflux transporter n=1 Tax=Oceanimonas doudoroffii TaxID=84158 RepID=A0A233RIC5_9GAMM|nr:MATE family efflux transporter [Oceanimonas doudoroffii]OXY83141.1 MATE family efflux transporter [Oceanimonas doudoroffii]